MQQIIVEKPYQFVPPMRGPFWSAVFQTFRIHSWYLARNEKVTSHEVRGAELLKDSLRAGHGVLLAPNHSRTADPPAMSWVATAAKCHVYGMASWHLFQSAVNRFALRAMGAFSVNREGVDRAAVNVAIDILASAERPLIVFPEGTTSRTNDRLGPLLDGVTFIARAATKKRAKQSPPGKVVIHPVGIKYLFQGDVETVVDDVLTHIERRLSWRPRSGDPLVSRIVHVGSALLSLKEIEYLGEPQTGTLRERLERLTNFLLQPHEQEWFGQPEVGPAVPRVRALRSKLLPDMVQGRLSTEERARRWKVLEDIYLAQQVASYPADYLAEPTVDRMVEIVEKYYEDLTDVCQPHGPTKAILEVGPAIEVSPERDRHAAVDPLLVQLETALQAMLNRLASESPPYVPRRFPA